LSYSNTLGIVAADWHSRAKSKTNSARALSYGKEL
jgi:hypothetical protein